MVTEGALKQVTSVGSFAITAGLQKKCSRGLRRTVARACNNLRLPRETA